MIMKKETGLKIITGLLVIALLAAGWFGYTTYSLKNERNGLREEVAELVSRGKQLQKKLAEQKALADQYLRAKSNLESELRNSQARAAELDQEKQALLARIDELNKKSTAGNEQLLARIGKLKENLELWKMQYEKLRQESISTIRERDQTIAQLTSDKEILDSSLNEETQQHNRCKKNNARLAELSQELAGRYQEKGVLGSLARSEPLTRIQQVELEKLVQEYLDKIDQNTL